MSNNDDATKDNGSSKRKRLRSVVFSRGSLGLMLKLVPIVILIAAASSFLFWEGQPPTIELNNGQLNDQWLRYEFSRSVARSPSHQIRILVFGVLVIVSLIYLRRSFSSISNQYRDKSEINVQTADDFLSYQRFSSNKFVLVLRPFGSDGFLYVSESQSILASMFLTTGNNLTVEQILSSTAQSSVGYETVAVIDPDRDLLAPGPQYVKCQEDWHRDVSRLIAAAEAVVIVLPAGEEFTPSLSFELSECFRWGANQKTSIVLPPMRQKKPGQVENILEELAKFIPVYSELEECRISPKKLLAILPGQSTFFYREIYLPPPFSLIQHAHSGLYKKYFSAWLKALSKHQELTPRDL